MSETQTRTLSAAEADAMRYEQSRTLPPKELRELLRRVFLDTNDGRAAFAFLIHRYHGEAPLMNERMVHEHNVIVDLKNLIGWGHTPASIRAQVDMLAGRMAEIGREEHRVDQSDPVQG